MRARVYSSYVHIYARIVMKFETKAHKIVIDYQIKFHKDRSFRCRDICKTILVFFNYWFSMYFWNFGNYAPPKPSKIDDYWIILNGPISVKRKHQSQLIFCILRLSHRHIDFDSSQGTPCSCVSVGHQNYTSGWVDGRLVNNSAQRLAKIVLHNTVWN